MIQDKPDVKLTVYEKCASDAYDNIKLDNVGRETHTFAHHFSENYDSVADTTICVAGNWKKHKARRRLVERHFVEDVLSNETGFKCNNNGKLAKHAEWKIGRYQGRDLDLANPRGLKKWSDAHIKEVNFSDYDACFGGSMIVSADNIRHNPRQLYSNIAAELAVNEPEAGHYMERLWQVAFT